MKTLGISPKVLLPLIVGLIVGVVFLASGDPDTGRIVLLAVLGYAGIGIASPPGRVEPKDQP